MSRRVRCRSCRTAFLADDEAGRPTVCPKCGADQRPPAPGPAPAGEAEPEAAESVFVPSGNARRPRRDRAAAALAALAVVAVVAAVAWPSIRRGWQPVPPDPVEAVATAYLRALADGDAEAADRLGTVDLPPAIRSFRAARHDPARDAPLRGAFAPVAAFHARLDETYAYDPSTGRYTPKNPLGAAAETLDALHEAKEKSEKSGLAEKIRSGDPDDLFDAAEGLAKTFSTLADGALAPRKLIPSYRQLVADARPPLPPAARELAADFGDHRETWDALLKRPFPTLRADGPFLLERAEVTATVRDALASLGDPPTTLRLTLTRFRLEGIDTGWKVTGARRESPGGQDPGSPGAGSRPGPG